MRRASGQNGAFAASAHSTKLLRKERTAPAVVSGHPGVREAGDATGWPCPPCQVMGQVHGPGFPCNAASAYGFGTPTVEQEQAITGLDMCTAVNVESPFSSVVYA